MDATSRKLVEDAARAAGYTLGSWDETVNAYAWLTDNSQNWWNPAETYAHGDCMGDALRLAVKLRLDIEDWVDGDLVRVIGPTVDAFESRSIDQYAATRRAIVRAAAAIGQSKEGPI